MREILFRGKRTDNDEGEFVYGIPVEGEPLSGMGKRTYIITKPGVQWVDGVYMTYDECIEVDPETVGRFTGLTDRNGVKIFEGDIIEFDHPYNGKSIHAVVQDGCGWNLSNFYAYCFDCPGCAFSEGTEYMTVLGNIYDNPELLEVGKNEM